MPQQAIAISQFVPMHIVRTRGVSCLQARTPGGNNTLALMISFGQLNKESAVVQSLFDCCPESSSIRTDN